MVRNYTLIAAVVLAASAGAANADVLTSANSTAGWQTFPGTLNNYGNSNRPFWDQKSQDGNNMNIGDLIHNGSLTGSASSLKWWGDNGDYTQNFDTNFYFTKTGVASSGLLKIEIAGNASTNVVGWYDTTNPSVKHQLWAGSATAGASVNFTPSANYGFYITGADGTFYTQSSLNVTNTYPTNSDCDNQHFAAFQDSTTPGAESYWIGVEDLKAGTFPTTEKNGDYNDFVFHVESCPAVPEPASLSMLGVGVAGLMLRRRRAAK